MPVVADIDKKKVVRKMHTERRKITSLSIRKLSEEKVSELIDNQNLFVHFKDGVLRECDKVRGQKNCRKCKGDT